MINPWPVLLFIALQLIIPHSLAFTVRKSARGCSSSHSWLQPHCMRLQHQVRFNVVDDSGNSVPASLWVTPKKDNVESDVPRGEEPDLDELSQELLLKRMGIDPNEESPFFSGFEAGQLPLPLFTSLVIFIGSTVLTIYGFYVGIMGFPNEGP